MTKYAEQQGITVRPAERLQVIGGKRATGDYDGRPFWIGSHRYLEVQKQETEDVH